MNFNVLSDGEFVRYADLLLSGDPIIKRLLDMVHNSTVVIDDLIKAGMDPQDDEFFHEGLGYSPEEYIYRLRRDSENSEDEYCRLQGELDEATAEIISLKTRSVAELIKELHYELKVADEKVNCYARDIARAENSEALAKEKLDMWAILNR